MTQRRSTKGMDLGGIRSIEDIRLRCHIDDITDCWVWRGARNGQKTPSMHLPGPDRVTSMGVAICFLTTGRVPDRGEVWHCVCETKNCANPKHRAKGNRSSQMRAARIERGPEVRARIIEGRRRKGANKLTDADVHEIRTAGLTLKQIMAKFGISRSWAHEVRSGKHRVTSRAPGASVFDWRPS